MPLTDYVESLENLLDFAVLRLKSYNDWNVSKFPSTDIKKIFEYMPDLRCPAALVSFESEAYAENPRAEIRIVVTVLADMLSDSGAKSGRTILRKAIELLDGQAYGDAVFRALSASFSDCGASCAAYKLTIKVSDR